MSYQEYRLRRKMRGVRECVTGWACGGSIGRAVERWWQTLAIWRRTTTIPKVGEWMLALAATCLVCGLVIIYACFLLSMDLTACGSLWWPSLAIVIGIVSFIGLCMSSAIFLSDWVDAKHLFGKVIAHGTLWSVEIRPCDDGAEVLVCRPKRFVRHRALVHRGEDFAGRLFLAKRRAEEICERANALPLQFQAQVEQEHRERKATERDVSDALGAIAEIEAY